ncbi:twk-6 [Pristionchus pacificus]|uniref:Twk-6 n=1 Tax=Pristionchus pacificus TaxID=54126 RepID=A0A2A6BQY8_PRIPA|nr:twk-6 [Pristionchus pacificus]|eukprot:PDM68329.1 twk-6 [Pristionchus pacificus]
MRQSDRSVGEVKSHPRVEHLRSRNIHRVRYHSFFSNSDSLVSEESASEEDVEPPSCVLVMIILLIVASVVVVLMLLGTAIFWVRGVAIGTSESRPKNFTGCLEKARVEGNKHLGNKSISREELILLTLEVAKTCDLDKKMILSTSDAAVYSWSLYSTVGYGDMFMHSGLGQAVTVFYAFFSSALYLALKAECGTIIARHLSDFIHFFRMAWRKIRCFKHRDPHPHPLRPIVRFFICLGLFFFLMFLLAVYMKMVEDWPWGRAIYFAYITMALIGLGDVVPDKKVPFIICAQPLLVVGDTLFSQVNWYMQDRLRFGLHTLLRLCQCERKDDKDDAENVYPSVTSKMLPIMVPATSVTALNAKNNNKKMTKKERKLFKARRKESNYSLRKIPNEKVFGPDRKRTSQTTTSTSSAPKTAIAKAYETTTIEFTLRSAVAAPPTQSGSGEPIEKESLL